MTTSVGPPPWSASPADGARRPRAPKYLGSGPWARSWTGTACRGWQPRRQTGNSYLRGRLPSRGHPASGVLTDPECQRALCSAGVSGPSSGAEIAQRLALVDASGPDQHGDESARRAVLARFRRSVAIDRARASHSLEGQLALSGGRRARSRRVRVAWRTWRRRRGSRRRAWCRCARRGC